VAKLVVIDRDGTPIRHIPYLCAPAQVEVLPTVQQGLGKMLMFPVCSSFLEAVERLLGEGGAIA
jgi:hypothetical protein